MTESKKKPEWAKKLKVGDKVLVCLKDRLSPGLHYKIGTVAQLTSKDIVLSGVPDYMQTWSSRTLSVRSSMTGISLEEFTQEREDQISADATYVEMVTAMTKFNAKVYNQFTNVKPADRVNYETRFQIVADTLNTLTASYGSNPSG